MTAEEIEKEFSDHLLLKGWTKPEIENWKTNVVWEQTLEFIYRFRSEIESKDAEIERLKNFILYFRNKIESDEYDIMDLSDSNLYSPRLEFLDKSKSLLTKEINLI